MKDLAIKQGVLQEIMDLMDNREGNKLKSHPRLMAAKVTVAKPKCEMDEDEETASKSMDKMDDIADLDPEILDKLLALVEKKG